MSDRDDILHELEHDLRRFDWQSIDLDPPTAGEMVIATDGVARWMDMLIMAFWDEPAHGLRWQGHIATHWHAVREVPHSIKPKAAAAEPEIAF